MSHFFPGDNKPSSSSYSYYQDVKSSYINSSHLFPTSLRTYYSNFAPIKLLSNWSYQNRSSTTAPSTKTSPTSPFRTTQNSTPRISQRERKRGAYCKNRQVSTSLPSSWERSSSNLELFHQLVIRRRIGIITTSATIIFRPSLDQVSTILHHHHQQLRESTERRMFWIREQLWQIPPQIPWWGFEMERNTCDCHYLPCRTSVACTLKAPQEGRLWILIGVQDM